jgi:Domain of unknown function (DUF4232)
MFGGRNVVKVGVVAAGVLFAGGACTGRTGTAHTDSAAPASHTRSASTGASPGTSLGAAGGGSGAGACRIQDMVVRLGQPTSAKFQEGTVIELANSGEACAVSGYLGLRLLDERGASMPTTVQKLRDSTTAAPVTLVRGGRVYATLVWNKYQGQGTLCRPYPASIAVSLPGQTSTVTAPWISGDGGSACQGVLRVGALRAAR